MRRRWTELGGDWVIEFPKHYRKSLYLDTNTTSVQLLNPWKRTAGEWNIHFFERGEHANLGSKSVDRIVRIGTHMSDSRFRGRIRQHYGNKKSLGGNKNGSVFRKHLGGALLLLTDAEDNQINAWLTQGGASFGEVERQVSQVLRDNFTFSCFRVDSKEERLNLERALIALLAQYPLSSPSDHWLGQKAESKKINQSGLWNTQQIDATPVTAYELVRLEELIKATVWEVSK